MTILEHAISPYLLSVPAITGLVGNRIYPRKRPQGDPLPGLTWFLSGGGSLESLQGSSGLGHPTVQFSAWSKSYGQAALIREEVRKAVQGFRGLWIDLEIRGANYVTEGEDYEEDTDVHQAWIRFEVWHREARP